MLSRVRWMLFGVGLGAGGSWWARRQARRAAARLAPAAVGRRVVDGAGRRIRAGWSATTSGSPTPAGACAATLRVRQDPAAPPLGGPVRTGR